MKYTGLKRIGRAALAGVAVAAPQVLFNSGPTRGGRVAGHPVTVPDRTNPPPESFMDWGQGYRGTQTPVQHAPTMQRSGAEEYAEALRLHNETDAMIRMHERTGGY